MWFCSVLHFFKVWSFIQSFHYHKDYSYFSCFTTDMLTRRTGLKPMHAQNATLFQDWMSASKKSDIITRGETEILESGVKTGTGMKPVISGSQWTNLWRLHRSKNNHRKIIVFGQIIGSGQIDSFMCIKSIIKLIHYPNFRNESLFTILNRMTD